MAGAAYLSFFNVGLARDICFQYAESKRKEARFCSLRIETDGLVSLYLLQRETADFRCKQNEKSKMKESRNERKN